MKNNFRICSVLFAVLLMSNLFSCQKEAIKTAPEVTIAAVTNITTNSATSGGDVTSDGGATVTTRGVCWSTSQNPTTSDSKTTNGAGLGSFTSSLTGLTPGVTYRLKAYAINSLGTSYSSTTIFTTIAPAPVIPVLSTTAAASITQISAASGGNITSDGGALVTARGVCWSTSADPTIALNTKTADGTGTGVFTSAITGLNPNTAYYVRAYATNSAGTAYGTQVSFTSSNLTDIEGNIYKTITIGTQTWMAENLKTTKYKDGTAIPIVTDGTAWGALSSPGYCWYNNDAATNKAVYGAMYNWYTVSTGKLCPAGWHVPDDAEWTTLINYLGGASVAGDKLKESGTAHWLSPNTSATNSSGFTLLPGGGRSSGGAFGSIGSYGYLWSSAENGLYDAWYREMSYYSGSLGRSSDRKRFGFSVRCLMD
jgi:uncharacterized protein (TIGR02145 family)